MKTYCQPVFVAPFGHVTSIYLVRFHVRLTFEGWAEFFFPTPMPKPPRGPEGPTHPRLTPCDKTLLFKFGANIQTHGAKIQIYGAKIQIYNAKTQICAAKIQIFDPKFKFLNFCTTKNLPLRTRKTPGAAGLTPTHPTIGVGKKLKRPPLVDICPYTL